MNIQKRKSPEPPTAQPALRSERCSWLNYQCSGDSVVPCEPRELSPVDCVTFSKHNISPQTALINFKRFTSKIKSWGVCASAYRIRRAFGRIARKRCHVKRLRRGKSTSQDDAAAAVESQAKVSGRLSPVERVRVGIARLAKALHYATAFNGRAVEPHVWALLALPDAELVAGLARINEQFAELPGFRPLGLGGELPEYHIYSFQRPERGL